MSKPKLTPLEYHKQHMHMYRAIDRISHDTHFRPVVRGSEICIADIDKNGNEVRDQYGN